jgi:hypothetical protein
MTIAGAISNSNALCGLFMFIFPSVNDAHSQDCLSDKSTACFILFYHKEHKEKTHEVHREVLFVFFVVTFVFFVVKKSFI